MNPFKKALSTDEMARCIREGESYELVVGDCSKSVTLNRQALILQGQGMMLTPSDPDAEWIRRTRP